MNIRPSAVPWIIAGVVLFFAGALAYGIYQGALLVPAKGFQTTIQRASNPLGFYVLAAFYAGLTGIAAYLLVAVLKAGPQQPAASRRPARSTHKIEHSMRVGGKFEITQDGRGGQIIARLEGGSYAFWWEFGGGNCVAFISVPTAEQWPGIPALAAHPRGEFLQAMADDVGRRQCPGARAIIGVDSIVFEA